jgi:hypothetical protein
MLLDDIYDEVAESLGTCEEATIFSRVTRGIQLLANRGLFDPLIGYLDVHINDGYTFALPREVKTVIRANINSNPSFPRTKLFEFAMNTEGSNEGEEIGFNWSDRGFIPLQDETVLPSKLSYRCVSEEDVGKTCTVVGTDADGQEATATLIAAYGQRHGKHRDLFEGREHPPRSHDGDCYLDADDGPAARFYPDERQPLYRAIKFSKTAAAVRIMFRRRTFKITSREDFIPLHSEMAVILAARAASFWMQDQFATANAILDQATTLIKEEQASLDEAQSLSKEMDVQPTIDFNIRTRDCIIVADIYNEACNIVGPIGRENVFDAITDAIEVLGNEAHWDSTIGYADLVKMDNHERINFKGSKGDGLFCLPRMVEAVLGMNICGRTAMPRNKWHEFHLNGPGSMATRLLAHMDGLRRGRDDQRPQDRRDYQAHRAFGHRRGARCRRRQRYRGPHLRLRAAGGRQQRSGFALMARTACSFPARLDRSPWMPISRSSAGSSGSPRRPPPASSSSSPWSAERPMSSLDITSRMNLSRTIASCRCRTPSKPRSASVSACAASASPACINPSSSAAGWQ